MSETESRKFFFLGNALKGIGRTFPQNQSMGDDYDYEAMDSVHQLWHEQLVDFTPNFNTIILTKGVKLTDLISSAPIPWCVFIVSEKLLDILCRFRLPPHNIYSVPIQHGDKPVSGYFAIHISAEIEHQNHIAFERSKFWMKHQARPVKIEELSISSVSDLHHHREQARSLQCNIWAEYFSMTADFLNSIDLFSVPGIAYPICFYASDDLRQAIETASCTGVRFADSTDRNGISKYGWELVSVLQA